jgi:hypothetical protein
VLGTTTQVLLFVAIGTLLTGCATIISGTTQDIEFSSLPPGANVKLNDGAQTVTPGKLTLKRKENYTALFTKDGFPERQAEVKRDGVGNWWVLGNILFGGLIGIVIDIVSGAQHHLGVGLVVTEQSIDTTTPTGRLLFTVVGAIALDPVANISRGMFREQQQLFHRRKLSVS